MFYETFKWTIIGKFTRTRPSIDIIRDEFTRLIPARGKIYIGAYDMKHVFIDFDKGRIILMFASEISFKLVRVIS